MIRLHSSPLQGFMDFRFRIAFQSFFGANYIQKLGYKRKRIIQIEEATHIQTYYVPAYADQAMIKLNEFFGKYLD